MINTSNKNTNTRKRRKIKFLISCIVITLFDALTLPLIFIYRVFENEKLLFDQNENGFVYNSIKSCHDDLNISIETLVPKLWVVQSSFVSFCHVSIVVLYYYRLVSILEGSLYQINNTQSNIFKVGFVSFPICGVSGAIVVRVLGHPLIGAVMIVLALIIYVSLVVYLMITLRKQLFLLVNGIRGKNRSASSIWTLMKRFTVLTIVSCSVSFPLPILFAISNIIIRLIDGDYSGTNHIITSMGWMIMYNNDILCIILQFSCYDQIYNCLCSKCQQLSLCKQKTISSNMEMNVTIDAKQ